MPETYTPEHLERWSAGAGASSWDSAANYAGADFSEFFLAPIHRTRDTADAVTLSNWRVVAAELEQLAEHEETGIASMGHWACGWYEIFLIHETDTAALQAADQWAASLADYPVADEADWSELECEQEAEGWESYGCRDWREAIAAALVPLAPVDPPDAERYGRDNAAKYWANDAAETISEEALCDSWHSLSESLSWSVQHESDGPSFNTKGAAELLSVEVLAQITGLALLAPDQEWRREPYPWPDGSTDPLAPALV